jgi:hypothetical protein
MLMMLVMNMLVAVRPTGQQASRQQTVRLKITPRCGQIRLRHLGFTATTDQKGESRQHAFVDDCARP